MGKEKTMNPRLISINQQRDRELQIHYNQRIYVPQQLQERILEWYHHYLVHPGQAHMEATIYQNSTWPSLTSQVRQFCKTWHCCQMSNKQHKKYGHLPPKVAEMQQWTRVNVDLVRMYIINTPTKEYQLWTQIQNYATIWAEQRSKSWNIICKQMQS